MSRSSSTAAEVVRSCGRVIRRNMRNPPGLSPSTAAASYSWVGIACSPARNSSM